MLFAILGTILIIFVVLAVSAFLFWKLWFCRDPPRRRPKGERLVISPANGTIAVIEQFDLTKPSITAKKWNQGKAEILCKDVAEKGTFILIMMTPMNVHYQRAPIAGRVLRTVRKSGKFLNAMKDVEKLVTLENEQNAILFENELGKVKIVQIAGVLARRIHCFVRPGTTVKQGDTVGFIDLGSQVAVVVPQNVKIYAKKGSTVIDGESILGEFR